MTDATGAVVEVTDYYPYGSIRIDDKTSTLNEQRKFAGHEFDENTGLSYMEARYYNGATGRFMSQDPVFQTMGDESKLKNLTNLELKKLLADPQGLNSYSYARNNPLKIVDPDGQWFKEVLTGQQSWSSFQLELGQAANQLSQDSAVWNAAISHPVAAGATIGVGSGLAAFGASAGLTALSTQYLGGLGTGCVAFCGQAADKVQTAVDYTTRFGDSLGGRMNQVYNQLSDKGYNFSDHAIQRISERGINPTNVINTLQNSKPFQYFHEGTMKYGYYDSATKTFIGQIQNTGKITTVINNVGTNYISNLIKTIK
jgi:RHS repeat-associated protein